MSTVLSWMLLAALLVHAGAHVAIAVGLVGARSYARAALALLVPPLAPWWGWHDGMRTRVVVWASALAAYAIGVAVA